MKSTKLSAYLQHGAGTRGPFRTEAVPVKETTAPRNNSMTGYGSRIPTAYMVKVDNRWRRVYCAIFSNSGTLYIGARPRDGVVVTIDRH